MRGAVDSLALFQCGLHSKFMRAFAMGVKVGLVSCLCGVWFTAKWALSPFFHYGEVLLAF